MDKVEKRDGSIVEFDRTKIERAIEKAAEREIDAQHLTNKVVDKLDKDTPSVEEIQDTVEDVLIEAGHAKTAKSYILYRQEHSKERSEKESILNGNTDEVSREFSKKALRVLASRYLKKDDEGNIIESPSELFERVATHMTIPDILHDEKLFDKDGGHNSKYGDRAESARSAKHWYHSQNDLYIGDHKINKHTYAAMANLFADLAEDGHMKVNWNEFLPMLRKGEFDDYTENWQEYYDLMVNQEFMPNCVPPNTEVATKTGFKTIEEIDQGEAVIDDKSGGDVGQVFNNRKKNMIEIETEDGYKVRSSNEHKFRVINSDGEYVWRKAENIELDDSMVLQSDFIESKVNDLPKLDTDIKPVQDNGNHIDLPERITPKLSEWLGIFIGDGTIRESGVRIAFDIRDDSIEHFISLSKQLFGLEPKTRKVKGKSCKVASLNSRELVRFLRLNDLGKKSSNDAKVPDKVKDSGRKVISHFLSGLFDADGSVEKRSISLYSNSYQLIKLVHKLLLGLGIDSKLSEKRDGYRISIRKNDNGKKFVEEIGFISSRKKEESQKFSELSPNRTKNPIPHQQERLLGWYKNNDDLDYDFYKRIKHFTILGEEQYQHDISTEALRELANDYPEVKDFPAYKYVDGNKVFKKVKNISDIGVKQAMDLNVPNRNTYIANGFVSHNSPTLMNAGNTLGQLAACFTLEIKDDMGDIMETAKEAALIFQSGGGVGANYSNLRPNGDRVASTSGVASGPVSFMRILDTVTDVVKQGGKRRGANMGILDVDHPDIKEFIQAKRNSDKLENFNISVGTTYDFWNALENNEAFELTNPRNGETTMEVDPESLLDIIAHSAWESADPGMVFFGRANEYNPMKPTKGALSSANPCSEQILYEYGSCNLGSINLEEMVYDGRFYWDEFEEKIKTATRFLDNVISMNKFPLDKIEKETKSTRRIGLGVMGLANTLYRMDIQYDSETAYDFMSNIAESLSFHSMLESVNLAKERGSFPVFEETNYTEGEIPISGYYEKDGDRDWDALISSIKKNGIRNSKTTTLPPTGSTAMIADTSHGIEPEFSLAYEKNVEAGDFYYANDVFEEALREKGVYSEELLEKVADNYGTAQGIEELDLYFKDVFKTALDIHYLDHLMAQAVWQDWIAASISKTINMPANAEPSDVREAFRVGHELGVKGLTVYRDDSKDEQVINMEGERGENILEPSEYTQRRVVEGILSEE